MHAVIFPVPTKIRERRQACTYILTQLPIKSNGSGLSKQGESIDWDSAWKGVSCRNRNQ